jgi:hypothetical protein
MSLAYGIALLRKKHFCCAKWHEQLRAQNTNLFMYETCYECNVMWFLGLKSRRVEFPENRLSFRDVSLFGNQSSKTFRKKFSPHISEFLRLFDTIFCIKINLGRKHLGLHCSILRSRIRKKVKMNDDETKRCVYKH